MWRGVLVRRGHGQRHHEVVVPCRGNTIVRHVTILRVRGRRTEESAEAGREQAEVSVFVKPANWDRRWDQQGARPQRTRTRD